MHNQIGSHGLLSTSPTSMHQEAVRCLLDACDRCLRPHVDAEFGKFYHQPTNKVRVETRQHMVASLEHRYLRSGASGNVRKLSCDVTAAKQDDPLRRALPFK